jgi:hypothetical protein
MAYDFDGEPACVVQFSLGCDAVREELEAGSNVGETAGSPRSRSKPRSGSGVATPPPAAPVKPTGVSVASSPV